jgi:2-oxoglutarate ferredoxin oxidoreductase subunit delta
MAEKTPGKTKAKAQKGYIDIIADRCKGCDLCIPVCPTDVIEKGTSADVNRIGWIIVKATRMQDCIACRLCAVVCPDQAIEVFRFDRPIPHEGQGQDRQEPQP